MAIPAVLILGSVIGGIGWLNKEKIVPYVRKSLGISHVSEKVLQNPPPQDAMYIQQAVDRFFGPGKMTAKVEYTGKPVVGQFHPIEFSKKDLTIPTIPIGIAQDSKVLWVSPNAIVIEMSEDLRRGFWTGDVSPRVYATRKGTKFQGEYDEYFHKLESDVTDDMYGEGEGEG